MLQDNGVNRPGQGSPKTQKIAYGIGFQNKISIVDDAGYAD